MLVERSDFHYLTIGIIISSLRLQTSATINDFRNPKSYSSIIVFTVKIKVGCRTILELINYDVIGWLEKDRSGKKSYPNNFGIKLCKYIAKITLPKSPLIRFGEHLLRPIKNTYKYSWGI